jgi:phage terminase Nu1 subunit (DNA packaging protein)
VFSGLPLRREDHVNILNSWKEIANYLGRGVRTVQRWERDLGLPVHRPKGKDRSAVLAFPEELDKWLQQTPVRSAEMFAGSQPAGREVTSPAPTRDPNLLIADVRSTAARSQKLMESLVQAAGRHQALAASLCQNLTKITRRTARGTEA